LFNIPPKAGRLSTEIRALGRPIVAERTYNPSLPFAVGVPDPPHVFEVHPINAYESGGFQPARTIGDLISLGAIYLTAAALWPLLIATLTFQYFGVLPRMMGP
jgi:hypothetical protein